MSFKSRIFHLLGPLRSFAVPRRRGLAPSSRSACPLDKHGIAANAVFQAIQAGWYHGTDRSLGTELPRGALSPDEGFQRRLHIARWK
jgi:hypothetical protein